MILLCGVNSSNVDKLKLARRQTLRAPRGYPRARRRRGEGHDVDSFYIDLPAVRTQPREEGLRLRERARLMEVAQ